MIASVIAGQWAVVGGILLSLVLIWVGGMAGMTIAERQFEKYDAAEKPETAPTPTVSKTAIERTD